MEDDNRNISQHFETFLLVFLLSLFTLSISDKTDLRTGSFAKNPIRNESTSVLSPDNVDAIIYDAIPSHIFQEWFSCNQIHIPGYFFDIQYKIDDHNRETAQRIISSEKTRLRIIPVLIWRYCFHLPSADNEILPVLI
jgi:hypothetical protein